MFRFKNKALHGVEVDKIGKNFTTYFLLILTLGAMTFFGVCDPSGRKFGRGGGSLSGAAATVGGESISRVEFQRTYQRAYQQYQKMYQDAFDPAQLHLAHGVLRQLVDERGLYVKAVELGIRASDDEVLQMLATADAFKGEDGKFSDEYFKRFLDNNGYTEASFLEEERRSMTVQKLRRFIADSDYVSTKAAELDYRIGETKLDVEYLKFDPQQMPVKIAAADIDALLADEKGKERIKEYYGVNQKEFNQPEQVQARHILISYNGARNATAEGAKRDKDAAKKLAGEILTKVRAPGANFSAIAKQSTDEPQGKTSGGDLGWITRESMDKAFGDAAFALNKGQISEVVESPFGFHIIQVEDKKPAVSIKIEDAQRKIAEEVLLKEKRPNVARETAGKVLEALKAQKPIDGLLSDAKVAWTSTGDITADARFLPGIGASKDVNEALVALHTPGQLFPRVLDVRGNFFIFRLKSRKEPDLSKFDKEKRQELARSASYSDGQQLFDGFAKSVAADLEAKGKVWYNPEFLALDEPKAKDKSGS